jgi:PEGA domain-containing protein
MKSTSRALGVLFLLPVLAAAFAAPASAQPPASGDFGSIAIRVRPANADVMIDGERWVSSESDGRVLVQLAEGRHSIEIRAAGYTTFSTTVDVRRGETSPLNVSLSTSVAAPRQMPSSSPRPAVSPSTDDNGWAIAPDYRIGELQHGTAQFAGVYGGRVFDGQFMIGAGAYWQTNPRVTRMIYGGPVVEWRVWTDRTIGFAAHALAGYGQARMDDRFVFDRRMVDGRPLDGYMMVGGQMFSGQMVDGHMIDPRTIDGHAPDMRMFDDMRNFGMMRDRSFFIAEPEAQVIARFGHKISLHAGVGYRMTSANDAMGLNGVSGSVSIQFGR